MSTNRVNANTMKTAAARMEKENPACHDTVTTICHRIMTMLDTGTWSGLFADDLVKDYDHFLMYRYFNSTQTSIDNYAQRQHNAACNYTTAENKNREEGNP